VGASGSLKMAEYGIGKLKEKTIYYEFYLVGVLTCLKGAVDYILEEYNQKYGLGIRLDETLNSRLFRRRAEKLNNTAALAFIDAYEDERRRLLLDRRVKVLLGWQGLRDVYTHRTQVSKDVSIGVQLGASALAGVETRGASGKVITSSLQRSPAAPPRPAEIKYYLRDWKDDDIDSLCEYSLLKVREFVELMRRRFPVPRRLAGMS